MSNWVEFEVPVDCPVCGHRSREHVEFDVQNRAQFVQTEKRELKCDKCDHEFSYRGLLTIDVDSENEDEP